MRKVFATLDMTEAVLLKDNLLHKGVGARVVNRGAVRAPSGEGMASEVWVTDNTDGGEVKTLVRDFLRTHKHAPVREKRPWRCWRCKEESPGEFESCWKCGQPHPVSV